MGARGPKKAPRELRILRSPEAHKGKDNAHQPIETPLPLPRFCPEKPDDLTEEASKHWDVITPELQRLGVLTPHNLGTLVLLCETWSRYRECQKTIEAEGLYSFWGGHQTKHPAVTILETAVNQYRALAPEFGLTPSSEVRLPRQPDEKGGVNPFASREDSSA